MHITKLLKLKLKLKYTNVTISHGQYFKSKQIWNNFFTKQRKTQPTIVVIFGLPLKLLKILFINWNKDEIK